MATRIKTFKAECTICKSPVYYYPVKLLLQIKSFASKHSENIDMTVKQVSCTCTGEIGGTKHTSDFTFPTDFKND